MNIATAIGYYKEEANFFAPDYEQDNELLRNFKSEHPTLSVDDVITLREILLHDDWTSKFFVADLLYLYDDFEIELLEPLIENAISFNDPSFNRIFLKPCIRVFGVTHVSNILAEKFISSDPIRKISISSLVYWLERSNNNEISNLERAIVNRSKRTDNIIELYYYNRYFPDKVALDVDIPHNAEELISRIKGNAELEDFLFNKLGWQKMNGS
jgi:hypothetical protein